MEKRTKLKDVARVAGVSATTVSFVLNNVEGMRISDDTRKKVLETAESMDYHPDNTARQMVQGKTGVIGFVIRQQFEQAYADLFLQDVLRGLNDRSQKNGYHILFEPHPPVEGNNRIQKLIRERHVDGIIVSGPLENDEELFSLHKEGAKVVVLGYMENKAIPSVDVDNVISSEMAVNHLIQHGHESIAIITNASLNFSSSKERLAGYRKALERHQIIFDEDLVAIGDRTPESGYKAAKELLSRKDHPTAIFVASDTVALGCLMALNESGIKVPDDIALVGFDDIALASLIIPPLTTVHLPAYGLGWAAGNSLIQQIAGELTENPHVILDTQLVIRQSCGSHN